jgi:hypothetical protein
MQVFRLRQRLIQDYGMHARSFIEIIEHPLCCSYCRLGAAVRNTPLPRNVIADGRL